MSNYENTQNSIYANIITETEAKNLLANTNNILNNSLDAFTQTKQAEQKESFKNNTHTENGFCLNQFESLTESSSVSSNYSNSVKSKRTSYISNEQTLNAYSDNDNNYLAQHYKKFSSNLLEKEYFESRKHLVKNWEFWFNVYRNYENLSDSLAVVLTKEIRMHGIPKYFRRAIWLRLNMIENADFEYRIYKDYIFNDKAYYEKLIKTDVFPYEKVIKKDLNRTFPHLDWFKIESRDGQMALYNLMKAYSLYEPEIGYCQGLGFVAGTLLLNLEEHEAFSVLIRLLDDHELKSMYTKKMQGLKICLYQLSALLAEVCPDLAEHLSNHNINPALYASHWFLTIFSYNVPIDLSYRIYDLIFCEGGIVTLMRVSLAFLIKNKTQLLELDDFEDIMRYLNISNLIRKLGIINEDGEIDNEGIDQFFVNVNMLENIVNYHKLRNIENIYYVEEVQDPTVFCKQKSSMNSPIKIPGSKEMLSLPIISNHVCHDETKFYKKSRSMSVGCDQSQTNIWKYMYDLQRKSNTKSKKLNYMEKTVCQLNEENKVLNNANNELLEQNKVLLNNFKELAEEFEKYKHEQKEKMRNLTINTKGKEDNPVNTSKNASKSRAVGIFRSIF